MKKLLSLLSFFFIMHLAFSQSDLQVLAIIKLNKTDSITVKQLKTRVESYQKQRGSPLSVEDRKKVLEAMIQEKLVTQAATKAGLNITDSMVDQYFLQSVSQTLGKNVTQSEFEELVKQQTGQSLDEYMKVQSGMGVQDYKAYLKSQLMAQQYILSQRQEELKQISPSDEEIRAFYELNKTSFVWTDMLKMFLVIVPKGKDAAKAKATCQTVYDDLKNKKRSISQITVDGKKEGSLYQAGDLLINKNQMSAGQLGVSYAELLELFKKDVGFISNITEQDTNFQFFSVMKKYNAKMLELVDIVKPETTTTVYDYIRQTLGQQKQMEYLTQAATEIAKTLDTEANVERKKKDSELDKLVNW